MKLPMPSSVPTIRLLFGAALALLATCEAFAQDRFATVCQIKGQVTATSQTSPESRELHRGDAVFVGERIHATNTSEAVLKTDDAGVIAIRPNTTFLVEKFAARGFVTDSQSVRILSGALRMISGWIGMRKKDNVRIVTPSATVGIRGTDHEPFVITAETAMELDQPEGTYDKVFSGGTTLQTDAGAVSVDPGKVGYAPVIRKTKQRALLTALMPTLLERVPRFYVPGAFDDQLETLAKESMKEAIQSGRIPSTSLLPDTSAPAPVAAPAPAVAPTSVAPASPPAATSNTDCNAKQIANLWLAELDKALIARNGDAFMQKFSADATVSARIRTSSGASTDLSFSRAELADSTMKSLAELQEFSTSRPVVTGKDSEHCRKLHVESITIERGVRGGASYRLESLEKYDLELVDGKWLAVRALTEQR